MANKAKGIGVGEGIALSKVFLLQEPNFQYSEDSKLSISQEIDSYQKTINQVIEKINELIEIAAKNISPEKADIFRAHLEIAKDEQIHTEVKEEINKGKSQAWAISSIFDKYAATFEAMDNAYFKERASDIKDLKKRFLSYACNIELPDLLLINEECIIVAHDLSPSETAILNKKYVKGFATNIGGATSHSAIMAKSLEIPAVVSLKDITSKVKANETIALDAKTGNVETELNKEECDAWLKKKSDYEKIKTTLEKYKSIKCITKDQEYIQIKGNIGKPEEIKKVLEFGGEGVGLFRSEFLYMESQDWPTEDQQFEAYKSTLEQAQGHEITIRTLDIGGDKHLNYFTFPKEINPFLGYRALRLSLGKKDIFNAQLRALLRASIYGKLKIMFPMVTTFEEFKEAKRITKDIETQLIQEGYEVSKDYKIGMMIEIPSAAIMADVFAKESDFFSIGSNDLIQYSHAVDRMSEEVNYLYQPNNPSILRVIKMAVDGCNSKNKEISVCGEMASKPISAILLLGLGIKHLSMSATAIPSIKHVLSQLSVGECKLLSDAALNMHTEQEVNEYVENYLKSKGVSY